MCFAMCLAAARGVIGKEAVGKSTCEERPTSFDGLVRALLEGAVLDAARETIERTRMWLGLPNNPEGASSSRPKQSISRLRSPVTGTSPENARLPESFLTSPNTFIRRYFWEWDDLGSAFAGGIPLTVSIPELEERTMRGSPIESVSSKRRLRLAIELSRFEVEPTRRDRVLVAAAVGDAAMLRECLDSSTGLALDTGIDCPKDDPDWFFAGMTAWHLAARHQDASPLRLLLSLTESLSSTLCAITDDVGRTPVAWAARAGCAETLGVLLQAFRDHHDGSRTASLESPAALPGAGRVESVRQLVNLRDSMHVTALHEAAAEGHSRAVLVLLLNGAEVDVRDSQQRSPLTLAAIAGDALSLGILLDVAVKHQKTLLNGKDSSSKTPLHHAAAAGSLQCLGQLITAGSSLTLTDHRLCTPLMIALRCGNRRCAAACILSLADRLGTSDEATKSVRMRRVPSWRGRPLLCSGAAAVHGLPEARPSAEGPQPQASRFNWSALAARYGGSECLMITPDVVFRRRRDADKGNLARDCEAFGKECAERFRNHTLRTPLTAVASLVVDGCARLKPVLASQRDVTGRNLAHYAAMAGATELLEAISVEEPSLLRVPSTDTGHTPLHQAAIHGRAEAVEFFIRAGINVNSGDMSGDTPLHWAAFHGNTDVVVALLDLSAVINVQAMNKDGGTALHSATNQGDVTIVRRLVTAGCGVNKQMKDRNCPLHNAAHEGHVEVVRLLLELGADPCAVNCDGRSPVHDAAMNGFSDCLELMLAHVRSHRADLLSPMVNLADSLGDTPLHWAACNNHSAAVTALLKFGADPNAGNIDGGTPLHAAAQHRAVACMRLLLQNGAAPGASRQLVLRSSCPYETPLMISAASGDAQATQLLLEARAPTDYVDSCGYTALHLACSNGRTQCVINLLEAGASLNPPTTRLPPLALLERLTSHDLHVAFAPLPKVTQKRLERAFTLEETASTPVHLEAATMTTTASPGRGQTPRRRMLHAIPESTEASSVVTFSGHSSSVSPPTPDKSVWGPLTELDVIEHPAIRGRPAPGAWRGFAPFFEDGLFSDVVLEPVDGPPIKAHRIVLAARCQPLAAMLTSGLQESSSQRIRIHAKRQVVKAFLRFLYAGQVLPMGCVEDAVTLALLGDEYHLPQLRMLGEIAAVEAVSRENLVQAFHLGKSNGMKLLVALCMHRCGTRGMSAWLDTNRDEAEEIGAMLHELVKLDRSLHRVSLGKYLHRQSMSVGEATFMERPASIQTPPRWKLHLSGE
jgi:ankyrin repeat protein